MTTDKTKILVVDDDPDMVLQLTAILSQAGHAVHSAATAGEAEEMLLSVHPDLAVIDLMMEEKDSGFVLCHRIKRLYPGTPVILLTAVKAATGLSLPTGSLDARAWLEADLVLDKPVRPEQIQAQVQRLLTRAALQEPK